MLIHFFLIVFHLSFAIFTPGTITVTVLPWIRTEGLTPENVPSLTEEVRSIMTSCLKDSTRNTGVKPNGSTPVEKQTH